MTMYLTRDDPQMEMLGLCRALEREMRLAGILQVPPPEGELDEERRDRRSKREPGFGELAERWQWLTRDAGAVPGSDFP